MFAVGAHAEAAGQRAGEVGQDIGMEVGRHDGIEALRLQRHPHRHRIDQHLVPGDVGNSFETSSAISSHITMPCRCAFDFVTTVRNFRGRDCASLKA
jgi:hypothetical protein